MDIADVVTTFSADGRTLSADEADALVAAHPESERFELIDQERRCSADQAPIKTSVVGTTEYATCQRGHRWQYSFGAPGNWIQLR